MRFLLFLLIVVLVGCKPPRHAAGRATEEAAKVPAAGASEASPVLEEAPEGEKALGSSLKTAKLSLAAEDIQGHSALRLTVEPDPLADYVQFRMCSQVDPKDCRPRSDPGEFSLPDHIYPDPPSGPISVQVRSCVRSYHATDGKEGCGPWADTMFVQNKSSTETVRQALIAIYEKEALVRSKCKAAWDLVHTYRTGRKFITKEDQQFETLLKNFERLGVDPCSEFLKAGAFADGEASLASSNAGTGLALATIDPDVSLPSNTAQHAALWSGLAFLGLGAAIAVGTVTYVKNARGRMVDVEEQKHLIQKEAAKNTKTRVSKEAQRIQIDEFAKSIGISADDLKLYNSGEKVYPAEKRVTIGTALERYQKILSGETPPSAEATNRAKQVVEGEKFRVSNSQMVDLVTRENSKKVRVERAKFAGGVATAFVVAAGIGMMVLSQTLLKGSNLVGDSFPAQIDGLYKEIKPLLADIEQMKASLASP